MTPPLGILLVDKPIGPTSHDVVDQIRRGSGIRRVGHAGTLDPFASGLLLLLLGQATRLSEYFLGMDKEYEATVRLGIETTSHDPEGEAGPEDPGWQELSPDRIQSVLEAHRGRISQVPPAYSAKKVRGEAAHRRTRRGEKVELGAVDVDVHELAILDVALPALHLRVRCSSGTYVRALARDLGRGLGVGAHLSALRRLSIGPFQVTAASVPMALVGLMEIQEALLSPAAALSHLPSLEVGPEDARRIRQGQFIPLEGHELPREVPIRVLLDGNLLAIGTRMDDHLRPRKVMAHG